MLGVVILVAAVTSTDTQMFLARLQQMFGVALPESTNLSGAWGRYWQPIYRYPIIAAHVGLSLSMALWPAQKNLGTGNISTRRDNASTVLRSAPVGLRVCPNAPAGVPHRVL